MLTVGAAYQIESDVTYVDPATQLGAEDYKGWTVDGFFEYPLGGGAVTASAAYEKVDLGDAYTGANPDAGATGLFGEKNGWYAKGGFLLPGTPLQFFGRYEKWRFACLNNVFDQIVDWYGFGANYYVWGQNLKLTARVEQDRLRPGGHLHQPPVDPHDEGLQPARRPDAVHLLGLQRGREGHGPARTPWRPRIGRRGFSEIGEAPMIKRFLAALAVVVLGATLALAAPMKGKVTAIDGKKVHGRARTGEKAAWLKKGASVKWKGGVGRVTGDQGRRR